MKRPRLRLCSLIWPASLALVLTVPRLAATNGMNMEGYGPVATALGGASMAYDNGAAAVINNPATLSLQTATARLDLALGVLGPQITATAPNGASAESEATAFFMPAFGYTRRSGALVYGLGIFGQGGMGCEYDANTWRGLGFGLKNRTEVSVGRVIVPLAWQVNEALTIAATADFVWAGMDLQMAMTGAQFMDLVSTQQIGLASGGIVQGFGQALQQMPPGTSVDYAYFNFANGSDFTGEASGSGYAGKIGVVYKVSPTLTFGATYHSQTRLSDLKAPGNSISFQLNVPGMGHVPQTLAGDVTVRDFEWPAMLGAGFAWTPTPRWLIAGDVRHVYWASVMENFNLRFVASNATSNGNFAGQDLNATLYQRWSDQTIFQLGAAWQATDTFTVRFGANHGKDPIPAQYLNCLFPATVEKHLTLGCGWKLNEASSIDVSYSHGFAHAVTNGGGIRVEHSQNNAQVLYSHRF
ncbi:OmpP1/FadL family transporter [Opitutus terrae]|uniref:Membrane protein involved in aromatic hydrocarbon degradation n=1 Tax=Opitutus terrae (strain DSM 11246 / JCM 15787 / PB90-1) TaxID=452637 RepID=B1ZSQ2_OPITP|nr:outer membrane protein transport protein [Opitutus terrae]ACB74751.1 membrane protein involved in aromatic hydrocarbon degradation [Opitutus terrae PB90-1]